MTNGNDSAYGYQSFSGGGDYFPGADGLTKREYFAAMAMQGLCSNPRYTENADWYEDAKIDAVQQADNLIAALNKEQK